MDNSPKSEPFLNYDQAKARQLEAAISLEVLGLPIKVSKERSLITGRPHRPILGCLCVWDSPDSPCLCRDWIWLPEDKILSSTPTGRKSRNGDPIHSFTVSNDAEIVVEAAPRSYSVRQYQQSTAIRSAVGEMFGRGSGRSGIARAANPYVVWLAAKAVVKVIDWILEPPRDSPEEGEVGDFPIPPDDEIPV